MIIMIKSKEKKIIIPFSSRILAIIILFIPIGLMEKIIKDNTNPTVEQVIGAKSFKKNLFKAFWCLHRYKHLKMIEVKSFDEEVIIRL